MKFNVAKFRDLRDQITSDIAESETDLIYALDECKALTEEITYNKTLLKTYYQEIRLLDRSEKNWVLSDQLQNDADYLQNFIWERENTLEEMESDIQNIQDNMETRLHLSV